MLEEIAAEGKLSPVAATAIRILAYELAYKCPASSAYLMDEVEAYFAGVRAMREDE